MRILTTFIFLTVFSSAVGQTNQDTLKSLEIKAREYLERMYVKQNFDSSIASWHDSIFLEIKEIYKKKGIGISGKTALLKRVKSDFSTFYNSNKNFTFLKFVDKDISDESRVPTVRFKYLYSEKVNGRQIDGTAYLYFILENGQTVWQIWDFRIYTILGDPRRWLE